MAGRRAYSVIRSHLHHALAGALLLALCVIFCALASTAPALTVKGSVKNYQSTGGGSGQAAHPHRRRCAKRANFKTTSKPHHGSGKARCRRSHRRGLHGYGHPVRHTGATHGQAPVPQNGVCPNSQMRPTASDLPQIRLATLCLVNRERMSHGEGALSPNGKLQTAAQGHSEDMSKGDYFEHDGRHGDTPLSRMRAAGYIFSSHIGYAVGENIAWATLWLATPKAIVASWMASPGHRANILDATFRESGIGVSPHPLASLANGEPGAIYTQDFGRIIVP